MNGPQGAPDKTWLTPDELCAYLAMPKATLYTWVSLGKIPAHKLGRLLRFKKEEIDELMETNRVEKADFSDDLPMED